MARRRSISSTATASASYSATEWPRTRQLPVSTGAVRHHEGRLPAARQRPGSRTTPRCPRARIKRRSARTSAIRPSSVRRVPRKRCCHGGWGVVGEPRQPVARVRAGQQGYRVLLPGGYVDAVKVRPREAADQAAAEAFLARHDSLRGARLGELVHPMDHPAFVAETAGGRLAGMLTYVPGQDWQQCEILTLHADQQWPGRGPP